MMTKNMMNKGFHPEDEDHAHLDDVKPSQLRDGQQADKQFYEQDAIAKHKRDKVVNKQRRGFLNMVGRAGISMSALKGSSFLAGTMASRYAMSQGMTNKKIVMVYVSQGAPGDQWLPDHAGAMRDVSRPYGDAGVADLMGFRHVDVINEGHSMSYHALGDPTYGSNSPTFDMRVAEVMGATTPYKMMYLGANASMAVQLHGEPDFLLRVSRAGAPVDGPRATLDRFFSSAPAPREDTGAQQMIDIQRGALEALRSKLGSDEYQRIDENLTGLSSLSARIIAQDGVEPFDLQACQSNNVDFGQETLNQGYGQAELIASAFACDLTNVAVLQVGDNKAYYNMPGYYGGEVHSGGSHSGDYGAFVSCGRGHHTVPAKMLQLLRDTTGSDGAPLIDNTLFVITNCMGDGRAHSPGGSPWGFATRLPGFQAGFSRGGAGNCKDFFSAIPLGLGLPEGTYVNAPGNPAAANMLI